MCVMEFNMKMSVSSDEIFSTRCSVDSRNDLIIPFIGVYPLLVLGRGAPRPGFAGLTAQTRSKNVGTCLRAQLSTALNTLPLSIRYLHSTPSNE